MGVVEHGQWRKSSFSLIECVEVRAVPDGVVMRDSKDREGPHLFFTHGEWDAFIAGAKAGEFDRQEVGAMDNGGNGGN